MFNLLNIGSKQPNRILSNRVWTRNTKKSPANYDGWNLLGILNTLIRIPVVFRKDFENARLFFNTLLLFVTVRDFTFKKTKHYSRINCPVFGLPDPTIRKRDLRRRISFEPKNTYIPSCIAYRRRRVTFTYLRTVKLRVNKYIYKCNVKSTATTAVV